MDPPTKEYDFEGSDTGEPYDSGSGLPGDSGAGVGEDTAVLGDSDDGLVEPGFREESDCGCNSGRSGAASGWLLVALLAGCRRRWGWSTV